MRHLAMRFLASSLVAVLAGCSGSGGTIAPIPPPNLPSTVVVTPLNGATGGAYRLGNGSWATLGSGTTSNFNVPVGTTAYSVAFLCGAIQIVFNATVTETTTVPADCNFLTDSPGDTPVSTLVSGTYDATAVAPSSVGITANDGATTYSSGSAGPYTAFNVDPGTQPFVLAAYAAPNGILGFKTLRDVAVSGATQTVNFPALTAADRAQLESITVHGATGSANSTNVTYMPAGGNSGGLDVTSADQASYYGVPPADWATGDTYATGTLTEDATPSSLYASVVLSSPIVNAPINLTLPTLSHTPLNADLSFPLPYNGLSANDVVKGVLNAEYAGASFAEFDIATPGWLAGRTSYPPPNFAGVPGFTTATPADVEIVEYAIAGFSFAPSSDLSAFLLRLASTGPPPGQTAEFYVMATYFGSGPTARLHAASVFRNLRTLSGGKLRLGLMQKH